MLEGGMRNTPSYKGFFTASPCARRPHKYASACQVEAKRVISQITAVAATVPISSPFGIAIQWRRRYTSTQRHKFQARLSHILAELTSEPKCSKSSFLSERGHQSYVRLAFYRPYIWFNDVIVTFLALDAGGSPFSRMFIGFSVSLGCFSSSPYTSFKWWCMVI